VVRLGLMDKVKEMFSKGNAEEIKAGEEEQISSEIQKRYGKILNLSPEEKQQLVESLTPREKETFFILLDGYSLKEAADLLHVRYSTVNTHQTAIYRKLMVNSRAELIINYRDVYQSKEK